MCSEKKSQLTPEEQKKWDEMLNLPIEDLCGEAKYDPNKENPFELDFVDAEDYDPSEADPEFW